MPLSSNECFLSYFTGTQDGAELFPASADLCGSWFNFDWQEGNKPAQGIGSAASRNFFDNDFSNRIADPNVLAHFRTMLLPTRP